MATFGVTQAAQLLARRKHTGDLEPVHPATVRRWADDTGDILPDYRPGVSPRVFSDADLRTLQAIFDLAADRPTTSRAALLQDIRDGVLHLTIPAHTQAIVPARPSPVRPSPAASDAALMLLAESLDRRLGQLQAERDQDLQQIQTLHNVVDDQAAQLSALHRQVVDLQGQLAEVASLQARLAARQVVQEQRHVAQPSEEAPPVVKTPEGAAEARTAHRRSLWRRLVDGLRE